MSLMQGIMHEDAEPPHSKARLLALVDHTNDTLTAIPNFDLPLGVGEYIIEGALLMSFPGNAEGARFAALLGEGSLTNLAWIAFAIDPLDIAYAPTEILRGTVFDFDLAEITEGNLARQPFYIVRITGSVSMAAPGYLQIHAANFTNGGDAMRLQIGGYWQGIPVIRV